MLRNLQHFTTLHSHTAVWCHFYCNMDCKTKLKPTRTISKLQTWFKFNHASSNQCRRYNGCQTESGCFANTLTRELTYEPSNYERAVLAFPRAHSITQAVGDSAVIVSRDQESELMSSLEAPCKKPCCVTSWCYANFLRIKCSVNQTAFRIDNPLFSITWFLRLMRIMMKRRQM